MDDDDSRFESFLDVAADQGLLDGCNPPADDRVCPNHLVTRGEMAIMIARALGADTATRDHFDDDQGNLSEPAVNSLADRGITLGCAPGLFCPDRPIRRGEMATFISRAFDLPESTDDVGYVDLAGTEYSVGLMSLVTAGGMLACDPPTNSHLCPSANVQRDEAAFALVKAMGLQPGIEIPDAPEMERLEFGDHFEQLDLWDGRSPSSRNRVSITGAGFENSALRVSIPRGSHFGADFKLDLAGEAERVREHLYFRYYLKLDADWTTHVSGKLPGFSGVYGSSGKGGLESSPDDPGWSARLMFSPASGDDDLVPIGYYVYHLGQARQYGDGMYWNEAGRLRPGDWYCLEGEVELNSPGVANGTLRGWVDGTPAFDMTGLEFRRPDEPEIRIESFWFDVYYGGKPTAPRDLGLTVDEVVVDTNRIGCVGAAQTATAATGDVDGDGYRDSTWWGDCPEGTCFWQETRSASGADAKKQLGDGAWFSVETDRLGLGSGDLNADGRDDLVYRGRCEGSQTCWRVHLRTNTGLGPGRDWGDGARFVAEADQLVLGDFDGDGRDDLTYLGSCGDDAHRCWRTHLSNGSSFDGPADWGGYENSTGTVLVGDLSGDGKDDILYRGPCGESTCWFSQLSGTNGFRGADNLGAVDAEESKAIQLIDFDGDGRDDILSWGGVATPRTVTVRLMRESGLAGTQAAGVFPSAVKDLYLRKVSAIAPVQAIAHLDCGDRTTCIEYRVAVAGRVLAAPNRSSTVVGSRPHVV